MAGNIFLAVLVPLWLGGVVYCLLAHWAARRFRAASSPQASAYVPFVSVLKPLSGLETNLETNLGTFFLQDYPGYEILFAVADPDDPALEIVEGLRDRYPEQRVRVIVAGRPACPNAKVHSLIKMADRSQAEILVISDSDVFVGPGYLRTVVQPFAKDKVGVVTCVYRGAPGSGFWSRLEALAMGSGFMPGVLVAWALEGMKFALGPTMAVRRECLDSIGGFPAMKDYLADDFVLGQWAVEQGYEVVLSPYVLDHRVLGVGFLATFKHRLRWARSSRRSRPWGYVGEGFTHPLAWAVGLLVVAPNSPWCQAALAATLMVRYLVTWSVAWRVLRDPALERSWWLVPLQDLVGFAVWCGGFTGSTVLWRGAAFEVERDGRFRPALSRE